MEKYLLSNLGSDSAYIQGDEKQQKFLKNHRNLIMLPTLNIALSHLCNGLIKFVLHPSSSSGCLPKCVGDHVPPQLSVLRLCDKVHR